MPGTTLIILAVIAATILIGGIGVFAAIKKFYHVASPDEALVKTGGKKPVVSVGGGMWVIPMFHKVARISTRAISIPITRTGEDAVPSMDKIPAEIRGEMKVQINPASEADIILASQSLGALSPDQMARRVQTEIDGLVTDALRTAAFQKNFIELNSQKKEFADNVLEMLGDDLKKFGLTLQAVAVTHVKQGDFVGGDGDVLDAEGRRNVAETVQKNRQETNKITRDAEVKVAQQDVDARDKRLAEELRQKKLEADNAKQVAEYEAQQRVETRKTVLTKEQEEKEAEAAQQRAIAEAQAKEAEKAKKAEIAKNEQIAIRQAQADAALKAEQEEAAAKIAEAEAARKVREEAAAQQQKTAEIAKDKAIEAATIEKQRDIKVADEKRQQDIETAEVERQVAVAEKRAEEAAARAKQAEAEAEQRKAEEQVITVKETAQADRAKQIVVIKAQEAAERDQINANKDAYVITKKAEGEAEAAKKRAEAAEAEAQGLAHAKKAAAQGEAEAIKIAAAAYAEDKTVRAEAEFTASENEAKARIKLAEATLKQGEAEAEALRLKVEAENQVATAIVLRDVTLAAIQSDLFPKLAHEIMAPVANVAHDVKVLQINGLSGSGENGMTDIPSTVLGTGLALSGALPVIKGFVTGAMENQDVKDTVGALANVAKSALREAAEGVAEGTAKGAGN